MKRRFEMNIKYTYRVFWSREDEEFIGICNEFPGLSNLHENRNEALIGIKKLVKFANQILHEKKTK